MDPALADPLRQRDVLRSSAQAFLKGRRGRSLRQTLPVEDWMIAVRQILA